MLGRNLSNTISVGEGGGETRRSEPLVLLATFLMFFWTFIYDISIIPASSAQGFLLVIALATSCGIVFLVALSLLAMFRPASVPVRGLHLATPCLALLGALCSGFGYAGNAVLYYLGISLIDICFEWAFLVCCLALSQLQPRQAYVYTAFAALSAYLLSSLLILLPFEVSAVLFTLCPPVIILLLSGRLSGLFAATKKSQPLIEARITKPYSWLPLTNKMFISLLFFMGIFGFAAQVNSIGIGLLPALLVAALVTALFFWVRRRFDMDLLYQVASLFVLVSLLLSTLTGSIFETGQLLSLSASALLFYLFQTLILASMAAQSQPNGLSFVARGNAVCLLGSVLGSLFGHLSALLGSSDQQISYISVVFMITIYLAFALIGLKQVSFKDIILHIDTGESTTTLAADSLRTACQKTATAFALTQREADVLELLARGRNSAIIERELIISRNTVKTHVRHIYEKLGCHQQQELIDIIEANL